MVLAQASVDACNDPLDHLQGSGALITCVVHLSVLACFVKWINDVNCLAVMIILLELARASWMTTTGWYPSPLLNPTG
jgi:hypothetical protein